VISENVGSDLSNRKKKIALILTRASKSGNKASQAAFLKLVQEKLFDLNVPEEVGFYLASQENKLFSDYNFVDPHDQQILNDKIVAINQILVEESTNFIERSPAHKRQILSIMTTKH